MKNFKLTKKLGTGTFATVYQACKKTDLDKVVAIKCIERCRLNKVSTENLFTEIRVMKELNHEHIVKLQDFEWDEKYIFLIMEYCSGGDLSSFIRSRNVLREKEARKFLRQIALALQFLQEKNIAHMDLKPQNLLLTGDETPLLKVADFGMSQHLYAGDSSASFRGSPLYMAPEIMMGQSYDAKVDLWSVGVILYETLFGMAPFASKTFEELEEKVLDDSPVKIPDNCNLSMECKDLLMRLLERDQNKRISFQDFFSHPFIDLEHIPGPSCLGKARHLVTQAVTDDSKGSIKSALNYYTQAIEYFIPAVEFEQDPATKEALREKIEQYIERAEQLKQVLHQKRPSLRRSRQPEMLLERIKTSNSSVKAALMKASVAEQEESSRNYKRAFDLYKGAVEILMPIAEESASPVEKRVIKSEIKLFLDRAEEVLFLSKQKTRTGFFRHLSNSISGSDASDSRCRVQ